MAASAWAELGMTAAARAIASSGAGRLAALMLLVSTFTAFAGFTVVIDPGHGGVAIPGKSDSSQEGNGASWNNALSASGRYLEKDLALDYSLAIKRAIEQSERARSLGIRVVLARETDVHLSAMERAAVAVRESADVFLSVHFNAANGKAEGTRVYYLSAEHPRWEFMHFANPYETRDKSFGEMIAAAVAGALQPFGGKPEKKLVVGDAKDRKDGIRLLGFVRQDTHLHNAAVALLEVEFIDNPDVEKWLLSDLNKEKAQAAVGAAVANALCDWFALPPEQRDEVKKARKAPGR